MDFDYILESITPTQTTNLIVTAVGALGLPSGTTAQRPTIAAGGIRWNTDTTGMELYNGSTWTAAGSGTVTSVAATGSTGLTVGGSPITTGGTITLTLGSELQGLSGLAANGMIARTGAGTYSPRTIAGTASNIVVTNGDGVAGAPTINLATAGTSVSNLFQKITTDTFGRVTATSAVSASDITTALTYTPINKAGDTGISSLTFSSAASITLSGGGTVTGLPSTPSGSTDAASKAYVDSVAQGLDPKPSVRVATTALGVLATSFVNGSVIDGITLVTGDRILIKNQTVPAENGIYTVNATGAPTRALDMDAWTEVPGAFCFVEVGTTQADTAWVCTSDQGGTLNTTGITFVQFGGGTSYVAGTGLTLTGNSFAITSPVSSSIGGTGLTSIGTASQILGVNTGATALEYKTVTAGTAISVTPAAGSITIANTGVTSNVAGTGISVSGATGAVTITNTGVTSLAGTANQITASASTGAVTLSVPSAFVAPGSIQITTGHYESTSAAVSAAGTTQGTGTALTTSYNVVTTAAASSGVILPTPTVAGWSVTVVNKGANPVTVYPASGGTIEALGANTGYVLAVGGAITFKNTSTTQWYTTVPVLAAGTGISITNNGTNLSIANTGVTSVALSLPAFITVTGSPVTTTGTLTGTLASQTANTVFIAPNGSAGAPTFRTLAYADIPIKLFVENPSAQTTPLAGGTNSVAIGSGSSASTTGAYANGDGTSSYIWGGKAFANGKFATAGDAQYGLYILRNITTTATPTEIYLDGATATQRVVLTDNSTWTFKVDVTGRRTDAVGGSAGYTFTGVIKRDVGVATCALVGAVSKTIIAETNVAWDATVTADATNGALKVTVTGEAAKTIRWVASVAATQTTN
jgi:hypothetical protein